jgi:MFS transporter, DHA1 family, multidrug resistance protein
VARPGDRRTVVTLLATAGSVNVAYTALIPLVPTLRTEMGASLAVIGLSFTAFALARAVAQVLGGYLVDRLTARHVAVGALLIASGAICGVAFSSTGTELVLWRVLWGAAEGFLTPALYRLGVLIATERGIPQARLMGWFGSAAVGGMAAGPAVVGVLGSVLDFRAIFLLAAVATVATAVLAATCLRVDERPPAAEDAGAPSPASPAQRGGSLRSMLVPVALFGCIDLVNNGLYAALEPVLPLTIGTQLGGGMAATAILFTWGLIVFAAVSGLGGGLVERVHPLSFSGVAFVLMAACLAVIGWAGDYVLLAIAFTAFMAIQPLLYVVARRGLSELCAGQARAFGYFGAVSDVGFVVGPSIGTLLLALLAGSAYFALAAIALCAGIAYLVIGRRLPALWPATVTPAPAGYPSCAK